MVFTKEQRQRVAKKIKARAARNRERTHFCDKCGGFQTSRGLTFFQSQHVCERCLVPDVPVEIQVYSGTTNLGSRTA